MTVVAGEQTFIAPTLLAGEPEVAEPILPTRSTDNPFAAASEDFFPNGQRKRLFDQLRHLSQWSRRALLVTGVSGSGKTVLYVHLSRALSKDASVAALSGAQVPNKRAMFVMLANALGIAHAVDAETERLSDLIRVFVQAQNEAERLCVILVDDAQSMDGSMLQALLALSAECRVRLIFFGDPELKKVVDKATVDLEIACHETPLLPLSVADTRAYVEWRTRQLGYTEMPFTEEQLSRLYSETDGIPGQIDQLASAILSDLADGKRTLADPAGPLLPLPHLWLALALAAVLGLLVLLFDSPDPIAEQAPRTLTAVDQQVGPAQVDTTAVELEQIVLEQIVPEQLETAAEPASTATPQVTAIEPAATVAEPKPQVTTPPAVEPESTPTIRPSSREAMTQPLLDAVPGLKGSDWLLQRDGQHFTVQLLTLGNREGMIDYLKRQPKPADYAVYVRRADSGLLYVVTYGGYETRAAAERATRRLPASVGKLSPWVRRMADVQQTIRSVP